MEPHDLIKAEKLVIDGKQRGLYLVGDELYIKERLLNVALSRANGPMGSMNKTVFQGNELSDSKRLFDELLQFPSMANERVIVIRNFDKCKKKLQETLSNFKIPETSFLVLESEKGGGNAKWHKVFKKTLAFHDVKTPPTYKMHPWVELFSKEYNLSLDKQATEYLIESAGISLFTLKGEIEKLSLLIGEKKHLKLKDIEEVVSHSRQRSIFDFTGALVGKNKRDVLRYLQELIQFGESTATIIYWLGRTINEIAFVKADILDSISPYQLRKLKPASKRFSPAEIKHAIMTIYRADMLIKTGKMKDKVAVYWAVGSILSSWK